jgi:hypothetical protein
LINTLVTEANLGDTGESVYVHDNIPRKQKKILKSQPWELLTALPLALGFEGAFEGSERTLVGVLEAARVAWAGVGAAPLHILRRCVTPL